MQNRLLITLSALTVLGSHACAGAARAQVRTAASTEQSAVLIMLVEQQSKKAYTDSEIEVQPLPEVRDDLAAFVRDTFGRSLAPSLSQEESRCGDLACQSQLAATYQAGYVLNSAIRRNFQNGVACTVTLLGISFSAGPDPKTASRSRALQQGCTDSAVRQSLHELAKQLLNEELGLPLAPPPPPPRCRSPYFTRLRGIGLGLGAGVALGGLGMGSGIAATRVNVPPAKPDKPLEGTLRNRAELAAGGFGIMGAGLLIGGAAMLPIERWARGSDPAGCVVAPEGRWGFGRSALVSFFATSVAASLLSAAVLGAADGQPCAVDKDGNPLARTCNQRPFWGTSLGLAGLHAVGLAVSIAVP